MPVLFQFAEGDGPIELYDIWKRPIRETLSLIESWMEKTIIGFNLAFDHFMVVKLYTTFQLADPDWIPEEHINEIAMLEPQAQDGPCLKPKSALDLLLHSRKGPYQSLMAREDIRIRRVPTAMAYALAEELEKQVQLDGIYFARSADKDAPRWKVFDVKNRDGEIDEHFKDVVLKFNPSGGLKFLAEYAMGSSPNTTTKMSSRQNPGVRSNWDMPPRLWPSPARRRTGKCGRTARKRASSRAYAGPP